MSTIQLVVPDIGDIDSVEVIEVLIKEGDQVSLEQTLLTLESDKASMEIPAEQTGIITKLHVKVGDSVAAGTLIAEMKASESVQKPQTPSQSQAPSSAPAVSSVLNTAAAASTDLSADVVVIGAGPGGYTAAFRAADLGKKVIMIERYPQLGGVCLNVGCIPSKALLHTAQIINESRDMPAHGVSFGEPEIDLDKLRGFKEKVVNQLTGGLGGLAKQRKVDIVHGVAEFINSHQIQVTDKGQTKIIQFENAIIATGSQSTKIPGWPYDDERLLDSTSALALKDIPERLLIIGGGIIGLEMGTVYDALGSKITVVELTPELVPGCDRDLVNPLKKRITKRFENIYLNTKVTNIESSTKGLVVSFEGDNAPDNDTFDRVLLAVGRAPNGKKLSAEQAGVHVDERGFIPVDSQQRTNVPHIFAIGDVVGQPMLAHKATHEGKTAAEVIAGMKSFFDAKTIPSVAYTDPEIAWCGLTETQAKSQGIAYEKGAFPWAASGRALSIARSEGLTKVLIDPETHRILGAGMVGPNAGELLAEAVLAIEMGADIEDVALSVHPHPTLSETFNFACEVAEGTCTDIYAPKKK